MGQITKEQITDELSSAFQASLATNMRRLIMLAVDPITTATASSATRNEIGAEN